MCPHLKELSDSVNQYFLNDQRMIIQNHSLVTDPFKEQARPMDFNRAEQEEFIDMVSGSTLYLQETSRNYLFLSQVGICPLDSCPLSLRHVKLNPASWTNFLPHHPPLVSHPGLVLIFLHLSTSLYSHLLRTLLVPSLQKKELFPPRHL